MQGIILISDIRYCAGLWSGADAVMHRDNTLPGSGAWPHPFGAFPPRDRVHILRK